MRHLILLHGDPAGGSALTADERRAVVDGHLALGREPAAAGTLRVAEAISDGVRVPHGDGTVTDGPCAGTEEQVGASTWSTRADAAAAPAPTRRMPASPGRTVEIRKTLEV